MSGSSNTSTGSLHALGLVLSLMLAVWVPGGGQARAADTEHVLRVALLYPRSPEITLRVAKYNRRLCEATDCAARVRVYYGGVAGDDKSVLRKMRMGQIDGAPLGLELMSQVVREALVLASPGLFQNYKQVDAVRKELTPRFDEEAYRNGFKVMGWGDVGALRLFGKRRIQSIADLRKARPWLYPQSDMAREFYRLIGATGVPLGIGEVYGALQTGMIDTYWASAILSIALQWHRGTQYMSERGLGFISGAFVFRRGAWDPLPGEVKIAMERLSAETRFETQRDMRRFDHRAYKLLDKRGVTPLRATDETEWWDAGHALRKRMVGRIYTRALVDRAERIAMRYASERQKRYWKHM